MGKEMVIKDFRKVLNQIYPNLWSKDEIVEIEMRLPFCCHRNVSQQFQNVDSTSGMVGM